MNLQKPNSKFKNKTQLIKPIFFKEINFKIHY